MNLHTEFATAEWIDTGLFDEQELMMDDELIADEFDGPAEEFELDFSADWKPRAFTARQRIEMVREERWLQDLVADFEDIDRIDGSTDYQIGGLSH